MFGGSPNGEAETVLEALQRQGRRALIHVSLVSDDRSKDARDAALAEIEPWHDQLDFDAGDGAPQGLPFLFEQVPATGPPDRVDCVVELSIV